MFIDTNVLLSFFSFTDEDIGELQKLIELLKGKKLTLWTTDQLLDEFSRNREAKINEAWKGFEVPKWKQKAPAFVRHYDEYREINQLLKQVSAQFSKLQTHALDAIRTEQLPADGLVAELLKAATHVEIGRDIYQRAFARHRRGSPPGKGGHTMGDELNWECLLQKVPSHQDLHIVSSDGDYASPFRKEGIHPYLAKEWSIQKGASALHYYTSLSSFFAEHFIDIKLETEIERAEAIKRLAISGSYSSTHTAIAQLSKFPSFSDTEASDLIDIANNNDQVGDLIGDQDVRDFFVQLWKDHPKLGGIQQRLFPDSPVLTPSTAVET